MITKITASDLKTAFLSAVAALDTKKDWINELNVFPVPDGDTGTNMTLTVQAAAAEVISLTDYNMEKLCKTLSSGSLRGARGNSGVITSQLIRGFTKIASKQEYMDKKLLSEAFGKAVETAYKAVMKPKEGTILTVAKGMSERAAVLADEDGSLEDFLDAVVLAGNETLKMTPEMLPVLKQAGVVDSGGQGLMVLFSAAVESLKGNVLDYSIDPVPAKQIDKTSISTEDIKFGYCTEFIIKSGLNPAQQTDFKNFLESIGDSIVCVADDELTKIHVHTNDPGKAISRALSYGELSRMKIDNMREEHQELTAKSPRKKNAVVAVSVGEGLSNIFRGLGVDSIIEGGQTMNPSTEDISRAISAANADTVYILPNNKNIILSAGQAALITDSCEVRVIPTKSIPLGITAMMNYDPEGSAEDNTEAMSDSLKTVRYCEITHAVRDTSIDGFEIRCGDMMAIGEKGMLAVNSALDEVVLDAVKQLITDDTELITLFYGEDVTKEAAEILSSRLADSFPSVEIDIEFGGQPVYRYFISVE